MNIEEQIESLEEKIASISEELQNLKTKKDVAKIEFKENALLVNLTSEPYYKWYVRRLVNGDEYIGDEYGHDKMIIKEFSLPDEAEKVIHAHRMNYRFSQIENEAKKQWGKGNYPEFFVIDSALLVLHPQHGVKNYCSERSLFDKDWLAKGDEMIKLMGSVKNLIIALKRVWTDDEVIVIEEQNES